MRKLTPDEIARTPPAALRRAGRHPLYVIVENVRSAFNVGSVLRTADALRAAHVYLTGFTPDGTHPGVHKAALGAQDTVPWSTLPDVTGAIREARSAGCTIVALEITDRPSPLESLRLSDYPVCLIIGNEVDGVSAEALALCDRALELPQFGAKHSLNVAVAFGVAAYDLVRHFRRLDSASASDRYGSEAPPS